MKTLTQQDINPFNPGLKVIQTEFDLETIEEIDTASNECLTFKGYKASDYYFNDKECDVKIKPILYHISWLTKEIMLPGYADKVIPLALLAEEIFGGIWIGSENYFAIKNPNSNCVAISQSTEQLKVYFEPFCVVVSALGEDGEMYSPPFDMNKVCRFLGKYHFNFNGISDDLVEYVTETFNPYIK